MTTTRHVKKVYQKGYAKTKHLLSDPRLTKVLEIAKKNYRGKVDKLLDLGCGDGYSTKILAAALKAKRSFGIDIASEAVKMAKESDINAIQLDIDESNFPYPVNYFDFIFCGNIIELVADADHLLSEVKRTLKPNGICLVTFPNIASWLSRIALFCGYLPFYYRVSTHYDLGKMFGSVKRGGSTGFIRLFNLSSFSLLADLHGLKNNYSYGIYEESLLLG